MLSKDYPIEQICDMMNVSRSGYYKWKKRDPTKRDLNREYMVKLVREVHNRHSTHGYRWTAAFILINHHIRVSENFVYKCYRFLCIKSETMHQAHYRPRKVKDKYPNLIFTTWDTVDRPRQVIVSDMTVFKVYIRYTDVNFEVTFYFDVFTKEMLSFRVASRRGGREQYIEGLEDVKELLKGSAEPVILHTDQGSVYASMAYNELIKDTNIIRSMSRAGKPTDNPVNEALNGWIKEELMMDFKIDHCESREDFISTIKSYMEYYNTKRPCWAVGYDTPENYRKRYYKGELEHKDTFKNRKLTEVPKFIQKKRQMAITEKIKQ